MRLTAARGALVRHGANAVRPAAVLILIAPFVAGCAVGDFGRAPGYAALNKVPSNLHLVFGPAGPLLTDEEKQLRRIADTIVTPPPPLMPALSLAFLPAAGVPLGESAYANYILTGPFRSATARYARLIDDVRNDLTQLDQFVPVARRVADLDHKREQSLQFVSGLGAGELAAAQTRIADNIFVLTTVVECLRTRAGLYRFTLERLVILLPSPMAAEAERVWRDLETRIAGIQVIGPRPAVVADAQVVRGVTK